MVEASGRIGLVAMLTVMMMGNLGAALAGGAVLGALFRCHLIHETPVAAIS